MDSERWERLQALFHQIIELPAEERMSRAEQLCAGDEALLEELKALIRGEADPDSLLDYGPARAELHRDLEGELVGPYRLTRRIGSGGMGSVYLAERADGTFERQFALKVVKRGMDTERVIQRFAQERQILARLDHPNIASIIDGGETGDGRPYFVMEYVDGLPITSYCDRKRLDVAGRLALFAVVCRAVQYAHQSLVVHRDLKPSNILVTPEGEVRLLDFGIAKLLDASAEDALTAADALLATPAYAAPEQLQGASITTTTDIYALGVVLYELLAGRRPFETALSPAEFRNQVLSADPLRPSTAVTQLPATTDGHEDEERLRAVSEARNLGVGRLRAALRGDLDTICLMALRREPERRYASAEQLATDLERHLASQPVLARPDAVAYRVGKFVRRHRLGVVSVSAAVTAFLALTAYYTSELARERDAAVEERAKTEEVVEFVTGLFQVADPAQSRGAAITVRELLDAGYQRIQDELAGRPAVQATMMRVLGEVYYELGLHDEATELLERALNNQTSLYGPMHPEIAQTQLAIGINAQTIGDFDAATPAIDQALRIRRALHGPTDFETIEAVSAKAFLEETVGDYAAAESLHLEAVRLARQRAAGSDDELLAEAIQKLAGIYRLQDRPEEAEPLLGEALAMQDRIYGGPHPKSDETKRQLAELLGNQRRFEEAETLYLAVIESRTKMMGPDHYELGSTWNSYGHLLSAKGDRQGAMAAYRRMIEIVEKAYAGPHPALAAGYNNIAILERNEGQFEASLASYRMCLEMQDAVGLAPDHPNRAYPITGAARVNLLLRRFQEAERGLEEALALRRQHFEEDHVLITELKSDLGAVLQELDRFAEAEDHLLAAYPLFVDKFGEEAPVTGLTAARLVKLYERTDRSVLAEPYRAVATDPADDIMLRY